MSDTPDEDDVSTDSALADAIAALPGNAEPAPDPPTPVEPPPVTEAPPLAAEPAPSTAHVQIPFAKYQGERQRRQAAEARIAELERLQQPQPAAAPATATPVLPDAPTVTYEDNPGEHLRQLHAIEARNKQREIDGINEKIKAYETEEKQLRERQQFDENVRQLDGAYQRAWAEAAGIDQRTGQVAKPELLEAYKFFGDSIIAEAMAGGYDFDQAKAILVDVERREAWRALSNEINPADLIVARARARGWNPQPQATPAAAVQPQPAVAAPAPVPAPAADQSVKRAAAVSKLSAASGGAAPALPSLKEVREMSSKDYAAYMKRNPDSFEKLITGAA